MMNRSHRFARRAIKVEQARHMIMQHVQRLGSEHVSLESCFLRRISEALYAKEFMPHFRRSGLDGYAVLCADAASATPQHPSQLRVIDEVPAGSVSDMQVASGTAIRVMTGSAVPEGANAVVMFEQTDEFQEDGQVFIHIKHKVSFGQNISNIGDEVTIDQLLMGDGTCIGPGQIALLASLGYAKVPVIRRPRVGILTTGSELADAGQPLLPGKIRNSNAYMLAAQIGQYGGAAVHYGTAPDRVDQVARIIQEALQECDMLLVSGGVSVGDYDVMADFFSVGSGSGSLEVLFNKIAMRPGSPTTVAVLNHKLVFGLSGNPGACFVGFELLAGPALLAMQGIADPFQQELQAVMTDGYDKGCPHERYIRGRMHMAGQQVRVQAIRKNSSSMLVSIQDANCLIRIPSGSKGISAGQQVGVIPLPYETTMYGK